MAKEQDPILKAELISRYLKGELSYEEHEQFRNWLEEDVAHQQLIDSLQNEEVLADNLLFFSSVDKAAAWDNLTRTIQNSSEQRRWPVLRYWKYVAAAIVLGVVSYAAFEFTYNKEGSDLAKLEVPMLKNDMLPGGNRATLTLGDGSVVSLEEMADGKFIEENGIRISKTNGQISYEIVDQVARGEVEYNTIHTPVGGQYHVILPDGTQVWLNSESSLHFPTVFAGSHRIVDLVGEGYFEVSKHKEKPFLVQTQKTNVKVLGTHFNLMAYSNERFSRTTLLEGSVEVSDGVQSRTIKPGQQAVAAGGIQIKNVHPDEAIAWKNGYFQFESEDLKTILRQLKRWYGFEIFNEALVPDKHFTAYISRNTTLSQVLKMLEMSGELKFKIEGKKILIQETP
jgi:ferric-dicitrate binding protein FerR (iron transport regulator)